MMTTSNTLNPNSSTLKSDLLRLPLIIIAGASVTFLLFAMMHAMIKQDAVSTVKPEEPVFISSILQIEEPKVITIDRIKPPPQIIDQPKTVALIKQDSPNDSVFSTRLSAPKIDIDSGTQVAIGDFDAQPRPMVRADPQYPSDAARNGIEGYVSMSFAVSSSGEVIDIKIIESEPKRVFDRAATRALSNWRYQPKKVDGRAVAMSGLQVRLDFRLDN